MTAELVTGFAGQNHITSDQVGAAMAGIVGTGAYVMAVGGRCAVSMTAANTCHMADGYVVIGGRVVKISATDLSIATGGQSVKRHDLVCVEYDKNPSTGVETASLVVVKGTAGTTAADPSYIAGDILAGASTAQFPLARVSLDGLTPTVELVADVLSPTKTLQDSASPTTLDGWTVYRNGTRRRMEKIVSANVRTMQAGSMFMSDLITVPLPVTFSSVTGLSVCSCNSPQDCYAVRQYASGSTVSFSAASWWEWGTAASRSFSIIVEGIV